ncbi:MAG: T9SS type A sorting domain-containing protein [Bacteroidota bacterium]
MKKIAISLFIIISLNNISFSQVGSNCPQALNITNLPFQQNGFNTANSANNYNQNKLCNSSFAAGNDYLFKYKPTYNKVISIKISGTVPNVGLFVIQNCPDDPNSFCVDKDEAVLGNPQLNNISLLKDSTYYFVVSSRIVFGQNQTVTFNILVNEIFDNDLEIQEITSPLSRCYMSNQDSISFIAKNVGMNDISNFSASLKINNGTAITETFSSLMNPGESRSFTFQANHNFSPIGIYNISIIGDLANDNNLLNDTAKKVVEHYNPITTFPYYETFENTDGNWNVGGANASWEHGIANKPIINDASTQNHSWITKTANPTNTNENSYIESPCFDLSGINEPMIRFNMWYQTNWMSETVKVQVSSDGGNNWVTLGALNDAGNWYNTIDGWSGSSNQWIEVFHPLDNLGNSPDVKIRIAFRSSPGLSNDGVAIDNLQIFEKPQNDLGVISISNPVSICALGNNETVKINIFNFGKNMQFNFPVTYIFNDTLVVTETNMVPVLPGDTVEYTFSHKINCSLVGNHKIKAFTKLNNDDFIYNDTTLVHLINYPTQQAAEYLYNFESNGQDWKTNGTNSSWNWGIVGKNGLNDSITGNHCWATNLTGNHKSNENSMIESPCLDISNFDHPAISFDNWYKTTMISGATIEVSSDRGLTWQKLGVQGDSVNWYNNALGWSGTINQWTRNKRLIDNYTGNYPLKVRIHFNGGANITDQGVAFDNIKVYDCIFPKSDFGYIIYDSTVHFMNVSENADSYYWDFGDSIYSTEFNPSHTYTEPGIYHPKLITFNECYIDTIISTIVYTGIENINSNSKFVISPNPNTGIFSLSIPTNSEGTIRILNTLGIVVAEKTKIDSSQNFDFSNLANGAYSIEYKTHNYCLTTKFIINR